MFSKWRNEKNLTISIPAKVDRSGPRYTPEPEEKFTKSPSVSYREMGPSSAPASPTVGEKKPESTHSHKEKTDSQQGASFFAKCLHFIGVRVDIIETPPQDNSAASKRLTK